ncbi:MAG: sulfite exporter TauE/SafE family protein [Caulobacteraceae bacterium]
MIRAIKPKVWVLLTAIMMVATVSVYVMSTDHSAGGFNTSPAFTINWLYSFSGLVVGALVGLTGVGGGSLMTPLLVLLFGFHPGTAVGTDLLYASATKSVGTAVHGANKTVDWGVTGRLAMGSVPTTIASVYLLYRLGVHGQVASHLISISLGVALLLTAVSIIFRQKLVAYSTTHWKEPEPRTKALLTTLLGAVLGVLVTLSSVGAGALGVTVLIFLYPRLPVARIVGSDIAHAVPLTLIAGLGHWWLGSVNFQLLGSLLIGSIPGIIVGSYLTGRIPETVLRPILAAVLVLVGVKMLT